jgi:hypothetical protein
MKSSSFLIASFFVLGCICAVAVAGGPRIAIWDPVKGAAEDRIQLDAVLQKQATDWLRAGGAVVNELSAQQIADPSQFSAAQFDAVVFTGNCVPRSDLTGLKQFADDGGVLVSLSDVVPFLIAVEPDPQGQWVLSPAQPKFAWQTTELLAHVGLHYVYKPDEPEQTVAETVTPLLKHYLAQAVDLRGKAPDHCITQLTSDGQRGEIYPLLRSMRRDGADVTPALYVARNGKRNAIICDDPMYVSDSQPKRWPFGRRTLLALATLAKDLHDGAVELKPDTAVSIRTDLAPLPPAPLDRIAIGSVEPDHAHAIARWGFFDGSDCEFGPALTAGPSLQLPVNAAAKDFPSSLEGGASVQLALPSLPSEPLFLRIRGAYGGNGAILKATLGHNVVLNESFVYIDSNSPGNFNHNLVDVPAEFTRIVFLPPMASDRATLTLSNPGTQPIYFDALQIESRTEPGPIRSLGLGAGYGNNYPAEISQTWSAMRTSLRTNLIGPPDDPKRFASVDALFDKLSAKNSHLEPILEGTPPWAAISPERLDEAQKAKRPHTVPPDPAKYAQLVADIVHHYGDRIESYEIWNEADISQFYRGTPQEYVALFKAVYPVIHKVNPHARIMTTGMSGYRPPFLRALLDGGVLEMADAVCFHPYAGKSPAWDMPYGLIQGTLMSWGVDKEIYCNESGFVWKNAEWFQPPPQFTPQMQEHDLSVAMGRLLASGLPSLSVFNAGGDDTPYGLFDSHGSPRPAYNVFADYVLLGQPGARRLDVQMSSPGSTPLRGVYAAASTYEDGSAAIVLNPAESDALNVPQDPSPELNGSAKWTCFFGEAQFPKDKLTVTVTPAASQKYAGFYHVVTVNPEQFPVLEVVASGAGCDWELQLKPVGGKAVPAIARSGAGTFRVNCRDLLKDGGTQDVEISFRVYSPITFEAIHFLPAMAEAQPVHALPIHLCIPLGKSLPLVATMKTSQGETQLPVQMHNLPVSAWAELVVPLTDRTVIQLRSPKQAP